MRIQHLYLILFSLACLLVGNSCSEKDTPPKPIPVIVFADTLSTGWTKKIISNESNIADIFFNSSNTGYLAGDKIHKSTDGGTTWNIVYNSSRHLNIFLTADNKAFFADFGGTIIKTTDGGNLFTSSPYFAKVTDIFFADNNTGYAITHGGLYKTIDGGISWQMVITTGLITPQGYNTLYFLDNTAGWVATSSGIYKSTGSLTNWQAAVINGGSANREFVSLYAVSATHIFAVNTLGEIYKSTDGGTNFRFIQKLGTGGFSDIHFINAQLGYTSAGRNIYKTTDGGSNWVKILSTAQDKIIEIHFTDAGHGWACGDSTVYIYKP